MFEVAEKVKKQLLQECMQLNPFNFVVALKKDSSGYRVEAANTKAILLFGQPSSRVRAGHYFQHNWSHIQAFLKNKQEQSTHVRLFGNEVFLLYKHSLMLNKAEYIFLILHKETDIEKVMHEDALTTLENFHALQNRWSYFIANKTVKQIALAIFDLDRFKKFNESLGKRQADRFIIELSKKFKTLISHAVHIYRMNGDKFICVMHFTHRSEVEQMLQKITAIFDEPLMAEGHEYFITASTGIATSAVSQLPKLDEMIHEAEQALFYVKKHERGQYRFYSSEIARQFMNEALMEAHLRRAIEFDELAIHFQPQKNLVTGKVDSFEALLRWKNRKFGQVSPGQFIPLAESSGLILPIGRWVLERVCQYMQEWQRKGYRPVRIAVNISPQQFKQVGFVGMVRRCIEQYEIAPALLELEITEGSMLNAEETTPILQSLKKLGVYVSVDDFGTGYSSLSYLKKYPIDIIKIDQSFIADIKKDAKNEAIVRAIILLSHNLGLEVIAEGVEELMQEQFLMDHNCQKVQGYLYNKPLPIHEMERLYLLN